MTDIPTTILMVAAGLMTALDPFVLGLFVLLIATTLGRGASLRRLLAVGSVFLLGMAATYMLLGVGATYLFSLAPGAFAEYLTLAVGIVAVGAGLLYIKDFFWPDSAPSLQPSPGATRTVERWAKRHTNLLTALALGAFTAVAILPCVGATFLAVPTLLSTHFTASTWLLVSWYALVVIAPLALILCTAVTRTKISDIHRLTARTKRGLRLIIGVSLALLGWLLLLLAGGIINLGNL